MAETHNEKSQSEMITGEFVTDGKTFVFRLKGTPLSGSGDSASAAFDALMRADATAGDLSRKLKDLAREQEGEALRTTLVRWSMIGLIVFGAVGGALIAGAAMAPKVAADVADSTSTRLVSSFEHMSPTAEDKLSRLLQRLDAMMGDSRACPPPAPSNPGAPR